MNKRERQAEKLRALREVTAPESHSDHEFGPFAIADAEVVLDAVLEGWFDRNDDAQHKLHEVPEAFEHYLKLHAMRRTLLSHACSIEELEMPKSWLKGSAAAWRHIGIRTVRGEGETHYHCFFCDEDLATLGHGTISSIAKPLMRKMTNHATACAMRFLMESVLGIYPNDPTKEGKP